jgi:DNA polymerase III subunit delta'
MSSDWSIVGNERAVRALQAAVYGGRPAHAYLFLGPEKTGRATVARRLAQTLNCAVVNPPCGECNQCKRIAAGIHSDVVTVGVEAAPDGAARKAISVDQMRDVERMTALNPYEGSTRVVVIDPADEMSDSGQSAFLKTLEEPPPHVVFVLIAANGDRLLETIRSRCARIDFGLVAAAEIEAALLARGATADDARLLARLSGGCPGWAIEAARSPQMLARRREVLETARSLARLPLADRMDLAEKLSDGFKRDRDAALGQLDEWAAWWRDVLLTQSGAGERAANLDLSAELREDAESYARTDIAGFLQALIDTRTYLCENVQSRIALEALMLAAPREAVSTQLSGREGSRGSSR